MARWPGRPQALAALGFRTEPLDDATADRARELRSTYGNKHFPMVDAVGIEQRLPIITCDARWPDTSEADLEVLEPDDTA